ncbi:hypothetical protein HRED_03055 [Candidatus Haloredivivus sp. G17]|nr:hypothetical protein HRED_03055 [Candidatus Haloredivivus sp. G17]
MFWFVQVAGGILLFAGTVVEAVVAVDTVAEPLFFYLDIPSGDAANVLEKQLTILQDTQEELRDQMQEIQQQMQQIQQQMQEEQQQ